jgi:hypothetical protein
MSVIYTPDLTGSGQFGRCIKCKLLPSPEGHDGCLGTLRDDNIMNACCGHGDDSGAYIQYWDRVILRGECAIKEQSILLSKEEV